MTSEREREIRRDRDRDAAALARVLLEEPNTAIRIICKDDDSARDMLKRVKRSLELFVYTSEGGVMKCQVCGRKMHLEPKKVLDATVCYVCECDGKHGTPDE